MADLEAQAGGDLELVVRGTTGLTVHAQVLDTPANTVAVARTLLPPVTGKPYLYAVTVTAPTELGVYTVLFDRGDPNDPDQVTEQSLEVKAAVQFVVVSPSSEDVYTDVDAVRAILSPDTDPTTDTASAASMADAEIQEAINEAAAEINARLAARYTIPFNPAPTLVEKLNRDIAAWLATLTFRRGDPIDSNDPVQLRYNRAQANLAAIQSGKTELTTSSGAVDEATADAEVINLYSGDLFLPRDFALGPAPFQAIGIPATGYDDDGLA